MFSAGMPSHLWPGAPPQILPSLSIPAPFPWGGNYVLGIAKLLLQIVHVKRETLQVVSLAMTALMRDSGRDFHITNESDLRPSASDLSPLALDPASSNLCVCYIKLNREAGPRTGCGDFRGRGIDSRPKLRRLSSSRKLVLILSTRSGSKQKSFAPAMSCLGGWVFEGSGANPMAT